MGLIYFEDLEPHRKDYLGEYTVDKDEVIEFARKWDPQPFHIDEEAAASSGTGGIIAPAIYTIGISNRLAAEYGSPIAALAGLGWDMVRFPHPVKPGDRISVTAECLEKRDSNSNPDAGIACSLIEVRNQHGELCLSFRTTYLVARKPE
ncbi:MAG: MaoC/PaaZ C-terminal domain-containing protein [Dehalococcoidia bacterium]